MSNDHNNPFIHDDNQPATKGDLKNLATKKDLEAFATKDDLVEWKNEILTSNDELIKELKPLREEQKAIDQNYKRLDKRMDKVELATGLAPPQLDWVSPLANFGQPQFWGFYFFSLAFLYSPLDINPLNQHF